jgi:hypothetical protein
LLYLCSYFGLPSQPTWLSPSPHKQATSLLQKRAACMKHLVAPRSERNERSTEVLSAYGCAAALSGGQVRCSVLWPHREKVRGKVSAELSTEAGSQVSRILPRGLQVAEQLRTSPSCVCTPHSPFDHLHRRISAWLARVDDTPMMPPLSTINHRRHITGFVR